MEDFSYTAALMSQELNSPQFMSGQSVYADRPSLLHRNLSGGYSFMSKPVHPFPSQSFSRQSSDGHISARNLGSFQMASLEGRQSFQTLENNSESSQRVAGCSADWWSMQTFSELIAASRRGKCNADNSEPNWDFIREGSDPSMISFRDGVHAVVPRIGVSQASTTSQSETQICDLCSRQLLQRSPWSSYGLLGKGDLPVVAVLFCGHLYHADCLEQVTSEIHKHDPPCPQCYSVVKVDPKMQGQSGLASCMGHLPVQSKIARSGMKIDDAPSPDLQYKSSYSDNRSVFPIDFRKKGTLQTSAFRGKRSIFARPFLKRQFSFKSKSNKDPSVWV